MLDGAADDPTTLSFVDLLSCALGGAALLFAIFSSASMVRRASLNDAREEQIAPVVPLVIVFEQLEPPGVAESFPERGNADATRLPFWDQDDVGRAMLVLPAGIRTPRVRVRYCDNPSVGSAASKLRVVNALGSASVDVLIDAPRAWHRAVGEGCAELTLNPRWLGARR